MSVLRLVIERRKMKKLAVTMTTAANMPTPIPAFAPIPIKEPPISAGSAVDCPVLVVPPPSLVTDCKDDVNPDTDEEDDIEVAEVNSGNGFCGPDKCTGDAAVNNASLSPQQ